ncbi:MAG: hypothetical protein IPQ05_25355 [Leptospiraceae bacterium]|nr:hypothetical protein [Leptospiraceae bacterium]
MFIKSRNEIAGYSIFEQYAAILVSACIHIAKSDGRISEKEILVYTSGDTGESFRVMGMKI